ATVLARRNEGREGRFPDDMPQDATPNAPPAQSRGEVSRAAALKRDTQSAAPSHEFSAERVRRLANSGVVKNDDGDELATGHLNLLHGAKWNSARTRLRIQQIVPRWQGYHEFAIRIRRKSRDLQSGRNIAHDDGRYKRSGTAIRGRGKRL